MAHITDVLKKPVLTEKTMTLQANENKYTFDVDVNANKVEIKQAVEALSLIHIFPCQVSSDPHERRNDLGAVSAVDSVKS